MSNFSKSLLSKDVIALACGAMIGWSWVLLTGEWILRAGIAGAALAFIVGSLVVMLIGLTYAELASMMPKVGGEHQYTLRALGYTPSFLASWAVVTAYVTVCVFEAAALPTALEYLFPQLRTGLMWTVGDEGVYLGFVWIGCLASVIMTWINLRGIAFAAFIQGLITLGFVSVGLCFLLGAPWSVAFDTTTSAPMEWAGMLSVLVMVPALLVGFDVIPQSAEEINLPARRIGLLLVISVALAGLWYVAITVAVGVSLPEAQLESSRMATADAMASVWGAPIWGQIMLIAGVLGILSSWNAFIIGGSRVIYALAESGMIPKVFASMHPRYQTPHVAILSIGVLCFFAPLFGREILVWLVNAGSFAIVIAYLFVVVSFIALRVKAPEQSRPFRVPFGIPLGIVTLVLTLGLLTLYLPGSPAALLWPEEWVMVLFSIIVGAVLYRRQSSK